MLSHLGGFFGWSAPVAVARGGGDSYANATIATKTRARVTNDRTTSPWGVSGWPPNPVLGSG